MSDSIELQLAKATLQALDKEVEVALERWLKEEHDESTSWDKYSWAIGVWKLQKNTVQELEKNDT